MFSVKIDLYDYDYLRDIKTRVDVLCEWICHRGDLYIEANNVLALFGRKPIKRDNHAGESDGSGQ